jgi:signal transduction histidine kinase
MIVEENVELKELIVTSVVVGVGEITYRISFFGNQIRITSNTHGTHVSVDIPSHNVAIIKIVED